MFIYCRYTVYICICVYIYIMCMCTYIYTAHIHVYICIYINYYVCVYILLCIYIYTYSHIHDYYKSNHSMCINYNVIHMLPICIGIGHYFLCGFSCLPLDLAPNMYANQETGVSVENHHDCVFRQNGSCARLANQANFNATSQEATLNRLTLDPSFSPIGLLAED